MDAYAVLRKMTFSKNMNETVKRAVRVRLQAMLEEREKQYEYWESKCRPNLTPTRQKEARRRQEKIIQAMKIIIHDLTPIFERTTDEPVFFKKK